MKTFISAIIFTLSFASISEAKFLTCQSFEAIEGWTGSATHDFAHLTAAVSANNELASAKLSGAVLASADVSTPDTGFTSKNPRYQDYTRFSALEDAWCWYSPFLPKQLAALPEGSVFTGFVNRTCENGSATNIAMKCAVE
ncbi:hypothetical protein DOM22_08830 [Bdellovibrio sp. ZAP7]|uniref:hypothetical protein n=1 Tax=Bdellovibrio sp. ZAP7 TaxID=2231053 RepID=UPI00115BC684|nr:hypothetical protein [Bdellovibrio sp. ZAP7]QDK45251.1 hypothetical protein DOM22_08830 [Bdellovibrio sp. ZAP7]